MKIDYENDGIKVKGLIKSNEIKYADIDRAYMRIEEACANMCCGRMNFDRSFLMIMENGELHKIELDNKELVSKALEIIKDKNPTIQIGKE